MAIIIDLPNGNKHVIQGKCLAKEADCVESYNASGDFVGLVFRDTVFGLSGGWSGDEEKIYVLVRMSRDSLLNLLDRTDDVSLALVPCDDPYAMRPLCEKYRTEFRGISCVPKVGIEIQQGSSEEPH